MNNNTIDVIITILMILSMCVMWFAAGYYKGESDGMNEERQEILNTIDSIHKQNNYILKGGKKDDQHH